MGDVIQFPGGGSGNGGDREEVIVRFRLRKNLFEQMDELVGVLGKDKQHILNNAVQLVLFMNKYKKVLVEDETGKQLELRWSL